MPAHAQPVEAPRLDPYLLFLFSLLSTATLFEGFDSGMLSFAAPEVRASLGIDRSEWGLLNGVVRLGVTVSFVFLLVADRWGRRNVMLFTVVGLALSSAMTSLATDKATFTFFQFMTRLFLTAEYSLAVIMIGEEFPSRLRGAGIAILTSLATLGVMLIAKTQAFVLLEPGAESNWLHGLGSGAVAWLQASLGLEVSGENWRALYVLGALPLAAVVFLRLGMRETRRFQAASQASLPWREALLRPWSPRYRRRTAIVTLLWNCVHMVTAPSVVYWVIFAREDLGLSTSQVGDIVFWGYGGGVAGHFVAGWAIDHIGRKWTCSGFYIFAAISIALLYQVPTLWGQYVFMIATVFCFGAANTATHVYASELFPTEIRASGYGWTTNLMGRVTEIGAPMAMGLLIAETGSIPWAITAVAVGPILGALLVLRLAPETRGLTLEEVQEHLGGHAESPGPARR